MDDLPISLISNQLKYTLSSLKIKTIQKARQFTTQSKDPQKVQKVKKYLNRYDDIKKQINRKINVSLLAEQNEEILGQIKKIQEKNYKNKFQESLNSNCIIELYGQKGCGKTSLLLYLCQKFSQRSTKKIYFINCASGVTYTKWQRLSKNCSNLQYRDAYILQHILSVTKSAQQDPSTGFLAIDSLSNLLMQQQKTLIFLIKLFKLFSNLINRGCQIIFTNYIQQWFQHKQQDLLTNHYSYYSSVTSEFIKYKYFMKKWKGQKKVILEMVRGGEVKGEFQIQKDGVHSVKIF